MSLRTRRSLALLTAAVLVVAACEAAPPATPPPDATPPVDATPTPVDATPEPVEPTPDVTPEPVEPTPDVTPEPVEQELVYPTDGQMTFLNNALTDVPTSQVVQWIYEGLYVYDDAIQPVPGVADGMPEISEDGLTWTIRLKQNVVFMPGEIPLTADDVVFTFEMAMNPNCRFNPDTCATIAAQLPHPDTGELTPVIDSVSAIDEHTVQFVLNMPYAPMLTSVLPGPGIDSRQATEAAFDNFQTGAAAVTPEEVADLEGQIAAEEANPTGEPDADGNPTADLVQFRGDLEELLGRAGLELPVEATYPDEGTYVGALVTQLRNFQRAQQAEAADAIAAAYPLLATSSAPVGAGPYYVTEFLPGQSLTLTANPNYHEGAPQLARIIVPIITDAVAAATALEAGAVDWVFSIESDQYHQIRDNPDIKIAEYADFAYFGVQYNLHEEHDPPLLFTDRNLREAVEWCFEKEATVETATAGEGIAIYADAPPASWAYNEDVPTYGFDPAEGRRLIEESGWVFNDATGVYEHPELGRELGTHFPLRAGRPDRTLYVSLMVDRLNTECGFNITFAEYDFATQLIPMLITYPHLNPDGSGRPFEAYFGGWGTAFDPDPRSLWHSSECSDEQNPDSFNYICFQNAEADEIIDQQAVELDFDARRELLWRFEEILATELPYSFAWSPIGRQGLRQTVNQVDAEWTEDFMTSPVWFWEMHKITNITAAQ